MDAFPSSSHRPVSHCVWTATLHGVSQDWKEHVFNKQCLWYFILSVVFLCFCILLSVNLHTLSNLNLILHTSKEKEIIFIVIVRHHELMVTESPISEMLNCQIIIIKIIIILRLMKYSIIYNYTRYLNWQLHGKSASRGVMQFNSNFMWIKI